MRKWLPAALVAALWLISLYAWISNAILRATQTPPDLTPAGILLLLVFLVVILYLAEGMEIAFADLRDKDIAQFQDQTTQSLLKEIQRDPDFFFSQRQVFVVSIISFVSILISNKIPTLMIWGFGEVRDPALVAAFHFVFINVLVLCACQVAPKRLAIINSERFLSQSRIIWTLIKSIGWLNIPGPADWLVLFLKRIFKYTNRKLPPSRASHFNSTALIHGYCIDQRSISLVLHQDGSGEIELHYLVIFLHGRRQSITGISKVGPANVRYIQNVEILGAWTMPSVEDLRRHEPILDEVYRLAKSGHPMSEVYKTHGLTSIDLTGRHEIAVAAKDAPADVADWSITFLQEYPESLNLGRDPTENMLCVLYRARGKSEAGAFYLGKPDSWSEVATTACRALQFAVRGSQPNIQAALQGCDVVLQKSNNELREEAARATGSLRDSGAISYLVQSATYSLKWNSMVTAPPSLA